MPTAISDGHGDRLPHLPESVDRVLGAVLGGQADLTPQVLAKIREKADNATDDSNLDRLPHHDVDVLFDGTEAVRVLVAALERRFATPIHPKETLKLVAA